MRRARLLAATYKNRKLQRAPSAWPGGRWFESIRDDDSFPYQINALRCIFDCEFYFILRTTRTLLWFCLEFGRPV
jgi:hypothetical protein